VQVRVHQVRNDALEDKLAYCEQARSMQEPWKTYEHPATEGDSRSYRYNPVYRRKGSPALILGEGRVDMARRIYHANQKQLTVTMDDPIMPVISLLNK
jgi:hypothetical protein